MADSLIGASVPRADGREKVTGSAVYAADIELPGMVIGKILRSNLPHARITSVEVERAFELAGVVAVLTPDDVAALPNPYYGPVLSDQPVLALGRTRYVGEPIVAVAAEADDIAEEALDRIRVEYEELPAAPSLEEAIAPGAPVLHETRVVPDVTWGDVKSMQFKPGTNYCNTFHFRHGDVEAGFSQAEVIVETLTRTPVIQHAQMEPHAAVAQWDHSGRLTVWTASQTPYVVQAQLAQLFGVPHSMVRVIVPYVGGGFGSKAHPKIEPIVAALARKARRPVRVVLTREEVFQTITRHASSVRIKSGASRDGRLVARRVDTLLDTGAYADSGPRAAKNAGYVSGGPYRIANVSLDCSIVYTNRVPAGSFRGFGVSQVSWNFEQHMDDLAAALEMDPLEFRLKNIFSQDDEIETNVRECLLRCARGIGWTQRPAGARARQARLARRVRGKGLACHIKATVTPSISLASVRMNADGSTIAYCGTVELGQGARTALGQIVAEELSMPNERVQVVLSDTDATPYDQSTTASRSTVGMGNAVRGAAADVKRQILEFAADLLEVSRHDLEFRAGCIFVKGSPRPSVAYADVMRHHSAGGAGAILGQSRYQTVGGAIDPETGQGKPSAYSAFWLGAACAAEVEVDTETGVIEVVRIVAAADAGKALHPRNCHMQNEGSAMMGLGSTLFEELLFDGGQPINSTFLDYVIPSFMEMPRYFDSALIEIPYRDGPFGAKGVAEVTLPAIAPAVGNAVFDAAGIRILDLPISPEKILRALTLRTTKAQS